MSTCVYEQDLDKAINTPEKIAEQLEIAAKKLRDDGEVNLYLAGTVHVSILLREDEDEPAIAIYA